MLYTQPGVIVHHCSGAGLGGNHKLRLLGVEYLLVITPVQQADHHQGGSLIFGEAFYPKGFAHQAIGAQLRATHLPAADFAGTLYLRRTGLGDFAGIRPHRLQRHVAGALCRALPDHGVLLVADFSDLQQRGGKAMSLGGPHLNQQQEQAGQQPHASHLITA